MSDIDELSNALLDGSLHVQTPDGRVLNPRVTVEDERPESIEVPVGVAAILIPPRPVPPWEAEHMLMLIEKARKSGGVLIIQPGWEVHVLSPNKEEA